MNENSDKPVIEAAKAKAAARAKRIKFIVLMSTTMASLFGLAAGSFAWFLEVSNQSKISAVMGDMDVEIGKITAYKYIYPFVSGSTEFIDYSKAPTLKGYVVQDPTVTFTPASSVAKTSTIGFGTSVAVTIDPTAHPGPRNVTCPNDAKFRYYLVGDETFTGVANDPWSTMTGVAFSLDQDFQDYTTTVSNIVISAGSKFTFYDKNGATQDNKFVYHAYGTPSASTGTAPFEVLESGAYIRCLKSGIYDIECSAAGLKITNSRSDEALIGNNMFDPTNVILEYDKSDPKPATLEAYIPQGIYEQNTMVVFDIELSYTNEANPIDAGLKVKRGTSSSINDLDDKYEDTLHHRYGYRIVEGTVERNPLDASDFYTFYAVFAKEANAFAKIPAVDQTPEVPAREVMWNAMHKLTNDSAFRAFHVEEDEQDFESEIALTLNPKVTSGADMDSTLVPPNTTGKYHCYIAVDYDYDHIRFFFDEYRLGNTYLLDRDFGFRFTSTQHLESDA